jgi:hypothetical protein
MMHYVILNYLILLVALSKVDANPVTTLSTAAASANPVGRILSVYTVYFTACQLPPISNKDVQPSTFLL